jgi:hypothetical protein
MGRDSGDGLPFGANSPGIGERLGQNGIETNEVGQVNRLYSFSYSAVGIAFTFGETEQERESECQ